MTEDLNNSYMIQEIVGHGNRATVTYCTVLWQAYGPQFNTDERAAPLTTLSEMHTDEAYEKITTGMVLANEDRTKREKTSTEKYVNKNVNSKNRMLL